MRRLIAAMVAGFLLLATHGASPAAAAVNWYAYIGSSGYNGWAMVDPGNAITQKNVGVVVKHMTPNTRYAMVVRRGTCTKKGTVVTTLPSIRTNSIGMQAGFFGTTSQGNLTRKYANMPGRASIWVGTKKCGTFGSKAPAATPTPTPTPTPVPGPGADRSNPIPLGQPGRADDWVITVTAAYPDAWPMVQAANMFNDPPAPGNQFFMVAISATYVGAGSGTYSGSNARAVGAGNIGYTTFGNSCGVLPDPDLEYGAPEVFSGGTINGNGACWEVASTDATNLVMYYKSFTGATVWFALR